MATHTEQEGTYETPSKEYQDCQDVLRDLKDISEILVASCDEILGAHLEYHEKFIKRLTEAKLSALGIGWELER